MLIRDATESDLPGILAIYNHVIATSDAVYTETPATLEDRQAWFAARRTSNYPCWSRSKMQRTVRLALPALVISGPGRATASVEHSVHVHQGARGQGIGSALVDA